MGKLSISYAGHLSDRVRDLYHGVVQPEGIDFHFVPMSPVQAFNRMLRGEFDCGEMSFATYVIKASEGSLPFVAIPVFPSRTFRHGAIYVNRSSGIREPKDLIGKTVGVPEYSMTAAIWARGALKSEYGVNASDIRWVTGGLAGPGRRPLVQVTLPGVSIRHEENSGLNDILLRGEIDALIAPQVPPPLLNGDDRLGYLFSDVPGVERDYYLKTRIFPIMHTVVIRRDVYEKNPWIAVSLFDAFQQSKTNCMIDLSSDEPLPVSLPWIVHYVNSIKATFGSDDFWPYGVERNKATIDALCKFLFEQGITRREVALSELFPESLLESGRIQL